MDACEHRWVAKLAPYQFDIKYVPGPKNVVADALSREPFVHPSVLHRLTRVPYNELLAEAADVRTDHVQDVFRWSTHPFDSTPVNYDSYVQALRRDMKEAMHVAQASAMKQLKRHADLYNRRVRGGPIDVGDRVLLANKGAHGKRKLADLWEDTTYTVVGLKDSHTYRIQHSRTGVMKTVHRNLIMPVNFLPLPDDNLESDTNENHLSDSESVDSVVADVSEDASNYRTRKWVSQLPSNGTNDADTDDVVEATDILEPIQAVDTTQSNELEHDVINSSDTVQLGPEGHDDIEGTDRSIPESTAEQIELSAPVPLSAEMLNGGHFVEANSVSNISVRNIPAESSLSRVRSRAGRLFKPVTRFIEIMNQQKVLG